MKMLEHFDQHNGVWIRAVQKEDTDVARLSQQLVTGQCQLYDVWLMPEHDPAFTTAFLEKSCFNSVEHLLRLYQVERSPAPMHATGKEHVLVTEFAVNLHPRDAVFDFSVVRTPYGPVISAVFGSRKAMGHVYEKGYRAPLNQQIDAEPST